MTPTVSYISVPDRRDMVHSRFNDTLYITTRTGVERYDLGSGAFLPRIETGGQLACIDVSPDGRTLAVADGTFDQSSLWVHMIDAGSGALSRETFPRGQYESGSVSVAFLFDGKFMMTSGSTVTSNTPLRIRTPGVPNNGSYGTAYHSSMLTTTATRETVFVSENAISPGQIDRYDHTTRTFRRLGSIGAYNFRGSPAANRDGTRLVVTGSSGTLVCDGELGVIGELGDSTDGHALGAVFSPHSNVFYAPWAPRIGLSDEIRAYDADTLELVDTIHLGTYFKWGSLWEGGRIRISDDGYTLFVAVNGGVSIVTLPAPGTGAVLLGGVLVAGRRRRR